MVLPSGAHQRYTVQYELVVGACVSVRTCWHRASCAAARSRVPAASARPHPTAPATHVRGDSGGGLSSLGGAQGPVMTGGTATGRLYQAHAGGRTSLTTALLTTRLARDAKRSVECDSSRCSLACTHAGSIVSRNEIEARYHADVPTLSLFSCRSLPMAGWAQAGLKLHRTVDGSSEQVVSLTGVMAQMMAVLALPPSDGSKMRVSLESR